MDMGFPLIIIVLCLGCHSAFEFELSISDSNKWQSIASISA